MSLYRWNAINANGEIVCTVVTSTNDKAIARNKIVFKMGYDSPFFKIVKTRSKPKTNRLGCDVELGGIGTSLKSVSTIMMIGGVGYLVYKFKLFGGLKWLKNAFRDLKLAPETIGKWEDEEIGSRIDQVDKMFGIIKQKTDNFSDYSSLYSGWQSLKSKAVSSYGKESYKKTFYESAKMSYFGAKSSREKLMTEIDNYRTKVLQALRLLQSKKNFKLNSKWEIISGLDCIPCLF